MISTLDIIRSWSNVEGNVNSTDDLLDWIEYLNRNTYVNISECSINDTTFWFYDDYNGEILNRKRSFFSIKGIRRFENGVLVSEQPIIIQPEIGYLGIICKKIDGVLNFLMQAKIEPGNVNCVQISPTIQATKSNFTRAHGGKLPTYFEYFEHSEKYQVIYDQIQSEQAARFYKKRNRNMIMIVNEEMEIYPNFKWMTLGQIKKLMEIDNLVNMDTRSVLSGIPLVSNLLDAEERNRIEELFADRPLYMSIFEGAAGTAVPKIYQKLNNYKMFKEIRTIQIPIDQLVDWEVSDRGITCKGTADFMVRYYDIEIFGREVQHWIQPLLKAIGKATFGLITRVKENRREFLVKVRSEIGSFDMAEVGPSVQWEPSHSQCYDDVEICFKRHIDHNESVLLGVVLSEEGGRFYHEENYNYIVEIGETELPDSFEDYLWVDYSTLNFLVQINNCLNIQLRNLLSLLKL